MNRCVWTAVLACSALLLAAPGGYAQEVEKEKEAVQHDPVAVSSHDPAQCAGCSAEAIWAGFLEHLRKTGHEDLIPENLIPTEDLAERDALQVDLVREDPLKGILFKLSGDLVNLDALWRDAPPSPENLVKARALAAKLLESKDNYLAGYGSLYAAKADIQGGDCPKAVKALEALVKSCYFLPRKEARRELARAYSCAGDDTLALLELQFYMLDLPPESEADETWAQEELRKIRAKKQPGPLQSTEESMRSISGLISGLDVGEPTQAKERRVEDVLEKVAKLIEKMGGG